MLKAGSLLRAYIVLLMLSLAAEVNLPPLKAVFGRAASLSLLAVFIGAALLFYFLRDLLRFWQGKRFILFLDLLFLLSGLVSAGRSPFPIRYGLQCLFHYGLFFGLSFGLLFIFSLDRGLGPFFLKTIAGLALFLALIAILESTNEGLYRFLADTFRGGEYQIIGGRFRAGATLPHPNILGCFMSVGVLLFLYLKERSGMNPRIFYPAVGVLCAAMALSGSRNAALVLLAPLVSLLFNRKTSRTAITVIALAVFALMVLTPSASRFADLWKTAAGKGGTSGNAQTAPRGFNTAGTRFLLWQSALEMSCDRPLFGIGPGGYNLALKDYAPEALLAVEKEKIDREHLNAHNGFLNILAEFGAAGAVFGLLFVCSLVRRVIRRHGFFPPVPAHAVLFGLTLSFMPDAFFYSRFYMVLTLTLWLCFAFPWQAASGPVPPGGTGILRVRNGSSGRWGPGQRRSNSGTPAPSPTISDRQGWQ